MSLNFIHQLKVSLQTKEINFTLKHLSQFELTLQRKRTLKYRPQLITKNQFIAAHAVYIHFEDNVSHVTPEPCYHEFALYLTNSIINGDL